MADENGSGKLRGLMDELPVDRVKDELQNSLSSLGGKLVGSAEDRIGGLTDKLTDVAENGGFGGPLGKAATKGAEEAASGGSPVKGALKGGAKGVAEKVRSGLGGGGGGGDKRTKATNIIEEIDVGVPVSVAYNQWTQFQDFSGFMKKVDSVDQEEDTKVTFKAQVFWSHRQWEATIVEQVPDEKIVWRSTGEKGHVDGSVTFHELAPRLTRILVVLEYYPQGLFERTGNLWRAQGRRARLELKHFRRHVMTDVIVEPDEVEGWRGVIRDSEVEQDHDEVVEQEETEESEGEGAEDEYGEEPEAEDEYEDSAEEAEYDEPAEEDEEPAEEDEEPADGEDEYEEEPEAEDEYDEEPEAEDEYEESEESEDEEEPAEDEEEPEAEDDYEEETEDEPEDEEEPAEEERPRRRRRAARR